MGRKQTLPGKIFGRLTVVKRVATDPGFKNSTYLCRCSCGGEKIIAYKNLQSGATKSCGCLAREHLAAMMLLGETNKKIRAAKKEDRKNILAGPKARVHPLYTTWRAMISRCHDIKHVSYKKYGGKGIVVCDAWRQDFWTFVESMGERPQEGWQLDRKESDGNYEPGNVRWVSKLDQYRNIRNVKTVYTADIGHGEETILSICSRHKISVHTVKELIKSGVEPLYAIVVTAFRKKKYLADGGKGGYAECVAQAEKFLAAIKRP